MLPSLGKGSAWPQLGKVALGDRSGKNGAPVDLKHFIFKKKNPADAKYYRHEPYHAVLGAAPAEIDIVLPFETVGETILDRRAMYGSNGLRQCFSHDEERAMRRRKVGEKMEWHEIECPAEACEFAIPKVVNGYEKPAACKPKAVFTFMVPRLGYGTFFMDFGSRIGARNISSALKELAGICDFRERPRGIQGIRCTLFREATAIDVSGRRTIKHIPSIRVDYARLLVEDQALLGPLLEQSVPKQAALQLTEAEYKVLSEGDEENEDRTVH